jgi:hypothetical protein
MRHTHIRIRPDLLLDLPYVPQECLRDGNPVGPDFSLGRLGVPIGIIGCATDVDGEAISRRIRKGPVKRHETSETDFQTESNRDVGRL